MSSLSSLHEVQLRSPVVCPKVRGQRWICPKLVKYDRSICKSPQGKVTFIGHEDSLDQGKEPRLR